MSSTSQLWPVNVLFLVIATASYCFVASFLRQLQTDPQIGTRMLALLRKMIISALGVAIRKLTSLRNTVQKDSYVSMEN